MKITDIRIEGFGVWNQLELKQLSPGVTAFYGLNEAGKSTVMQFVRSVLYGMTPARRKRYLPPVNGGLPGGSLGILNRQEQLDVRRIADRDPDDLGHVTITDSEGHSTGDRLLREALADIDEETFTNIFAIGLEEIQQLATLTDTQAAQWLYRLTSGLDRVSLYDVMQDLRRTRRDLLAGSDQESKIVELGVKREVLVGEIEQHRQNSRKWAQLAVRIKELDAEIEVQERALIECERRARTLEIAIGLKPNWRKRDKITAQLEELRLGVPLAPDALPRLDELNKKIEHHGREADILEGQRRQLREDCEQLGINELLVKNSCRIEALGEQRDWLQSLERQIDDLDSEAENFEQRLANEQQRLASALGVKDNERLQDIDATAIEDLQPYIETVRSAQKLVDKSQRQLDLQTESERTLKAQIDSAIVGGEKHGLPMDIEQASDLVAQLRRREKVERRLEQARKHSQEMEAQSHDLLDDQVMPLSIFGWSLAAVVVGALFVGLRLLAPESPLGHFGSLMAVLGAVVCTFGFVFKYFLEDAAADKLDACHIQLEVLARQIADAQQDKEQLDAELSITDGSAELRLEAAERHLEELESMLPVEAQRRQAGHEVASAESRHKQAQQNLEAALAEWKSQLVGLGFSEKLDPQVFLSISDRYQSLSELQGRARLRREEIEQRQREHAAVTRRVIDVATEVDCLLGDDDEDEVVCLDQLEHLIEQRAKQLSDIQRREGLFDRAKELKAEEGKHRKSIAGLKRRREALFQTADCDDEAAYRQLAEKLQQARELEKQLEAISREITAAIGTHASEETFAELLSIERISQLDERWEKRAAELQTEQDALESLVDERGALRQEQRTLAKDRSLAERQLELSCVEKQIDDARQSWRELSTFNRILERTREYYEAYRQPDTLAEASIHLAKLTGGQYTRVWTPLADDILLVETSEGESLKVDVLSRGTREQLLLSVRLALVSMFAQRGINLPMVLDDVLVNFDATRTQRAAEVLTEFAAGGHQLLFFTCHEHMWRMFGNCQADCRRLPRRIGAVVEQPVVEEVAVEEVVVEEIPEPVEVVEVAPEPEPEPIVEEVAVQPPPAFYDYPFVERIEEDIVEELVVEESIEPPAAIEMPVAQSPYSWETEDSSAETAENPLAFIVSDERPVSRRA